MTTHRGVASIFASLVALAPLASFAAPFTAGNLILVQVSGTTNAAGPVSFVELTSSGSTVQTLSVPSGNGGAQISATASSEGQIALNASGDSWTLAGYVPPYTGSGSLSSRTGAQAPRGFVTVATSGSVSAAATQLPPTASGTTVYSAQNIRSGVQSGNDSWFGGSSSGSHVSGIVTASGTSLSTQVQNVNTRNVQIINGDLYYSTGSGVQGLYKYTGLPSGTATSTAFLTGVANQGTNPYDFALSTSGSTLYVADAGIGVQKFTFNGSAWTHAYNFTVSGVTTNAAFGLGVVWSTANPTLYWTSPTNVYTAVDAGIAALGTSIYSISSTTGALRGLDVVPVPEPSAIALAGLGIAAAGWSAWRRRVNRGNVKI